jgi:hypothetical protein
VPDDNYYREQAIKAGALEPQTPSETFARNLGSNLPGERWEDSATAQQRLAEWTEDFRRGRRTLSSKTSDHESGGAWAWVLAVLAFMLLLTQCPR